MRRSAIALLLLTAVAGGVVLVAGPGAQASPDTTFTVNSTADPGDDTCDATECTLREAIAAANASAGTDTIEFNIAGTGPHTISPGSALPTITDPVIIDGTTEPDFAGSPVIELDGSGAGDNVDGLRITAGSSTVRGLVINRFRNDGIELYGSGGNIIEGSYIGTDVTGSTDLGNWNVGVLIIGAPNNTIGGTVAGAGNVISGNDQYGVYIYASGATGNQVLSNYIGTDKNGTADLGNSSIGVYIGNVSSNYIGGTATGAGNVISGNDQYGVRIEGSGSTGNYVQGNHIGTDVTGTAALGNAWSGVSISSGASNNTIGGTAAGAGNVISANHHGLRISGSGATQNELQGNFIGTDVTGTTDLGNFSYGVWVEDAPSNTIGGTAPGAGNVISANGSHGVWIDGSTATGNLVQGNYVGTDVNGTADLGNSGYGVFVFYAPSNTIGGTVAGAGNSIAYHGSYGVLVDGPTATGNTIRGNSIYSNGAKGIDNQYGGNTELAAPVIDGLGGSVHGHTSPKCYPCTVEVFSDNEDEGRIYHGSTTTNDDVTGTWTYPGAVTGPNVTATITDASGNTSEFSDPFPFPVGGIAELPDVYDSSGRNYIGLAGLAAAALLAVTAGGWYAGRRRLR